MSLGRNQSILDERWSWHLLDELGGKAFGTRWTFMSPYSGNPWSDLSSFYQGCGPFELYIYLLGVDVQPIAAGSSSKQKTYILELLDRCNVLALHPASTPFASDARLKTAPSYVLQAACRQPAILVLNTASSVT